MSRYTDYYGITTFTIKKGKERDFQEFMDKYEFNEHLLHLEAPQGLTGMWKVRFGTEDFTNSINHFHPDEQFDWFCELSSMVMEEIDLICLDEEFPILNTAGFAYHLYCNRGVCQLIDLKLTKAREED